MNIKVETDIQNLSLETTIIGDTLDNVKQVLTNKNKKYRISCMDGNHYMLTRDYVSDRINLSVEKGIVVGINFG